MFEPSPQQKAIFHEIAQSPDSLYVEAVAGSGKTTTIVEACKLIPANRLCLFLAFNKNIATELQKRLPGHVQAKTFHSHGFGALARNLPQRPRVDESKIKTILKEQLSYKEFDLYFKFCSRLIGLAKNAGVGTTILDDSPDNWWALIDHYALILDSKDANEDRAIEIASATLSANNRDRTVIDFDDMLYLCVLRNITFDKNNFVFLDEAQDTNAVQRFLLHNMLARDGRLVAVGDPAQAIYGFRGADADALEALAREFHCKKMPLSVSWRCSKAVVQEARKYVSHIEPADSASEGELVHMKDYLDTDFDPTQVILCRNTAPLVSMAFAFIRRDRGVRILGREIGQGLIALVKKMNSPNSLDSTMEKLETYRQRETNKLLAKGHDSAVEVLNDRIDCLNIFAESLNEDSRTVAALTQRIDSLFNDQTNGGLLTLCSVHKAKGLEWHTVNILDFHTYMPSKWAKQPWQKQQETNLIYVAITRAKHTLRYVNSGGWKKPQLAAGEQIEDDSELSEHELSYLNDL